MGTGKSDSFDAPMRESYDDLKITISFAIDRIARVLLVYYSGPIRKSNR